MDVQAGGRDNSKAPSATTNEAGTQGRHGVRQGRGGNEGGRQEKVGAEPLVVGANNGGREASRMDPESHGVGEGEGGHEAYRVAENLGVGEPQSGQGSRVALGSRHPCPLCGSPTPRFSATL